MKYQTKLVVLIFISCLLPNVSFAQIAEFESERTSLKVYQDYSGLESNGRLNIALDLSLIHI